MFIKTSIFKTFIVLILLLLTGCGTTPTAHPTRSGAAVKPFDFDASATDRCIALGDWISNLERKYPNNKWNKRGSFQKEHVFYLFSDEVFVPTFGKILEALTKDEMYRLSSIVFDSSNECRRLGYRPYKFARTLKGQVYGYVTPIIGSRYYGLIKDRRDIRKSIPIIVTESEKTVNPNVGDDQNISGQWKGQLVCDGQSVPATANLNVNSAGAHTGTVVLNPYGSQSVVYSMAAKYDQQISNMMITNAFTTSYETNDTQISRIYRMSRKRILEMRNLSGDARHIEFKSIGLPDSTCKGSLFQFPKNSQISSYEEYRENCRKMYKWIDHRAGTTRVLNLFDRYKHYFAPNRKRNRTAIYDVYSDETTNGFFGFPLSQASDEFVRKTSLLIDECTYFTRWYDDPELMFTNKRLMALNHPVDSPRRWNKGDPETKAIMTRVVNDARTTNDSAEQVPVFKGLTREYSVGLYTHPTEQWICLFEALIERTDAMERMAAFAKRKGLKTLPLLPLSVECNELIRPDDEPFKAGTDEDVVYLLEPIIIL